MIGVASGTGEIKLGLVQPRFVGIAAGASRMPWMTNSCDILAEELRYSVIRGVLPTRRARTFDLGSRNTPSSPKGCRAQLFAPFKAGRVRRHSYGRESAGGLSDRHGCGSGPHPVGCTVHLQGEQLGQRARKESMPATSWWRT